MRPWVEGVYGIPPEQVIGSSVKVEFQEWDDEREWAYDRESHVGRLDRGLDEAAERGWIVVDMKKDWKTIYPGASR